MKTTYLRWMARLLSLALTALFTALVIGEGPPPLWPLSFHTLLFGSLIICITGMLIAWRWELGGGLLILVAVIAFYGADFANTGFERFPGGWVFPLLFLDGLLYVFAGSRRSTGQSAVQRNEVPKLYQ